MKTVLVSISAKNIHKSLAVWCLKSYCEAFGMENIEVVEENINVNVGEIVGKIFELKPDVLGFSCYIWNIEHTKKIATSIKKLLPKLKIILGGPEVSFEESTANFPFADYIIRGEGEVAFFNLLSQLVEEKPPKSGVIDGIKQSFDSYPTPYSKSYFDSFEKNKLPIKNQLVYFESSRGCPFSCAYCLSSTTKGVEYCDIEKTKAGLNLLVSKGAKCIKFVDRTFNADKNRAKKILEFILSMDTDCTFHFEVAADLFDDEMLKIIQKMPVGRVQFEIGIQSTNKATLLASSRKTDIDLVLKNIKQLVELQNCHVHVDLIAGLPFETFETFIEGINQAILVNPHQLQLGFLKMLNGTKLKADSHSFGAVFSDFPPYEIYQTDTMSYDEILELKKIEAVVNKFFNSGAFNSSVEFATKKLFGSPFEFFKKLSDFCGNDSNLKISMKNAYTLLCDFLLQYGEELEVKHHIKLDCLSHANLDLLPDSIKPARNKAAEALFRTQIGDKSANIRIEFFQFDNTMKLFNYTQKDPLTNRFPHKNI